QRGVLRHVGHRVLADLGPARARPHRRQHFLRHCRISIRDRRRFATPSAVPAQFAARHAYIVIERAMTDYATALEQWLAGTDASGERAAARKSARVGFVTRSPAQHAALERVRAWTRERFALDDDIPMLVTELACTLPGCPPRETVVAFWTAEDRRH